MSITVTHEGAELVVRTSYADRALVQGKGGDWRGKAWRFPATEHAVEVLKDVGILSAEEALAVRDVALVHRQGAEPWAHQRAAFQFMARRQGCILAMDMGTGKSKVIVDFVNSQLCPGGGVGFYNALIFCPLSVLSVWRREFQKFAATDSLTVAVIDPRHSVKKRVEGLRKEWTKHGLNQHRGFVVVVNYDSILNGAMREFVEDIGFNLMVIDESHKIKSPSGKTSRAICEIGKRIQRRVGLSGTVLAHSLLDAYAQFRAIDRTLFGSSFVSFRTQYAVFGGYGDKQVVGFKNIEAFRAKFDRLAFQVKAADVLDLPERVVEKISFPLPAGAEVIYRELEENFWVEVEGGTISASNAMVELLRLQQICSGFARDTDTEKIIELHNGKLDALRDLLEGIDFTTDKAVIFCIFKWELAEIRALCFEMGLNCGEISGACKDIDDQGLFPLEFDVLACQIASGGVGIDLTAARFGIYYSMGFSLSDYTQSLARIHRPGQTRPVAYYHLLAERTVDERIYKAVMKRSKIIESILKREQE